jgi:hypothetical protein
MRIAYPVIFGQLVEHFPERGQVALAGGAGGHVAVR